MRLAKAAWTATGRVGEQQPKSQASRRRIRELEQEVNRKDKSLAQTTALLAVRKKASGPLGGRTRGRLAPTPEQHQIIAWVEQAVAEGARQRLACDKAGICERTYQRWKCRSEVHHD